ncbi:DUF4124 domain-containing protein [Rhodoferax sp.]|uniref:DUF4124 domain-containing protein n=1 Tax=Rhodoferax sp. TaxID=50421 RepID=UPI0028468D93|nr:DUF4124 domain-containing protein [Rhodoferax sp.]MDR3371756.1 DUF4124 domain-containing protein [Rhodoferax sp.]
MNSLYRSICLVVLAALSSGAYAQWQWVDKDGRKVFSDRAPPPGVPDKDIIKRPGQSKITPSPVDTEASATGAAASAPSAANSPKISGVDKDLAEKKKKADQEEAAKRKVEEDKRAKTKADNCARAKQAKAGLDSGVRLSRTNQQGEREILDDAARAAESQRIQSIIDSDCK